MPSPELLIAKGAQPATDLIVQPCLQLGRRTFDAVPALCLAFQIALLGDFGIDRRGGSLGAAFPPSSDLSRRACSTIR
jgi:hypothetical protein